jgi:quercetin dioxygenase-like cupin family protein
MTPAIFKAFLLAEGFPEPVLVERERNGFLDLHSHSFEVRALITYGQMEITIDGDSQTYGVGEAFHLTQDQIHTERYGSDGVRYLASRRQQPPK